MHAHGGEHAREGERAQRGEHSRGVQAFGRCAEVSVRFR